MRNCKNKNEIKASKSRNHTRKEACAQITNVIHAHIIPNANMATNVAEQNGEKLPLKDEEQHVLNAQRDWAQQTHNKVTVSIICVYA